MLDHKCGRIGAPEAELSIVISCISLMIDQVSSARIGAPEADSSIFIGVSPLVSRLPNDRPSLQPPRCLQSSGVSAS